MDTTVILAFLALLVYGGIVGFLCYSSPFRVSHKGLKWMNARERRRRSMKQAA